MKNSPSIQNDSSQETERLIFRNTYLLVVFLIFTAGFFLFPVTKWHCSFFYIFILIPYILTINLNIIKKILTSRIYTLILALTGYLALTLLWGQRGELLDYLRVIPYLLALLVFLCVAIELTLTYEKFPIWLSIFLAWSSFFGAIIYIYISGYSFTYPLLRLDDVGVSPSAIQLGDAYGAIMLMLYYNVISKSKSWTKLIYTLIFISALTIVILTQSRGPILGLIIAFLIGSILSKNKLALCLISSILAGVGVLTHLGNDFLQNLIVVRGTAYRPVIWKCALLKVKENIFFGHGIFEKLNCVLTPNITITRAHNLYISTLLYGGLVGLFLIISLTIKAGWQAWFYSLFEKNYLYLVWIIYGTICVFTGYDQVIYRPHPVYIFFWLPFGFLAAYEIKKETTIPYLQQGE
jgi:O-antigen ligase